MPDVNDEMKAIADYAIKTAREKYKVELDYSVQSMSSLESILEKIYWGFYSRTDDKSERGIIYNTAIIWGSYLGEFMRLKWGGKWALNDSKQIVSIRNIEFSPISFIYHKLSGRVKTSIGDYIFETNGTISRASSVPQREAYVPAKIEKPAIIGKPMMVETPVVLEKAVMVEKPVIAEKVSKPLLKKPSKQLPREQPRTINRDLLLAIGGIAGIIIIFIIFIVGFIKIRTSSVGGVGLFPSITDTYTVTPSKIASATINVPAIIKSSPTITLLPTYTPKPTNTLRPSRTPSPTPTETPTATPTTTSTPTETEIPWRSPTPTRTPTKTEPPPPPPPTATVPPPPTINSCEVSPSTVPAGIPSDLTFIAHFSAPGFGFTAEVLGDYPGSSGCTAASDDGNGNAECSGSSGMVPSSTSVDVLFTSSVGNCTASFQTQ